MKVYIPFNMIVDVDFGIIRLIEKANNLKDEYPVNKLKSFLLKRENENPIPEYSKLRGIGLGDSYNLIMGDEKYYNMALKLSSLTDILSFVINTHKLGVANEMKITVVCNTENEIEYFKSITSSLKYSIDIELNMNIKLDDYDYIFIKYLDEYYIDYLVRSGIKGKRLYVADYAFNTILDPESNMNVIKPEFHLVLDSIGCVVSTISVYNKK